MTAGGLHGKIVALGDHVVTLEIAPNVRVRVIGRRSPPSRRTAQTTPRKRTSQSEELKPSSTEYCSSSG